jgi:hypothetical protein
MKSIPWTLLAALVAILPPAAAAQSRQVSLRTLCFRHVDDIREVLLVSGGGAKPTLTPVKLFTSAYSDPVGATITGGRLVFAVQGKDPGGEDALRTVARGPLATGSRQVAIFLPSGDDEIPYRLTVIDETEERFPMGSTLIYNLTPTKVRFTIGEHRKELESGVIALVPLPTRTNERSQATVRVSLADRNGAWVPVSSTVWKVSRKMRTLALAFLHPGSNQPTVQCFQETPPWRLPKL